MALEYNGHRIGAMQYNGVTIGEAMMDGQIVYRADAGPKPVSGEYGPTQASAFGQVLDSYTITKAGDYLIAHTMTGQGLGAEALIMVNGGGDGFAQGPSGDPSTVELAATLAPGDVVTLSVYPYLTVTVSGTWSIVKN